MRNLAKMGKCISKEKQKEDMISKLPDSLISQILLYLPTNQAVRTSVLSRRWRSQWLSIPALDLNSREFQNYNAFVSFMNNVLEFLEEENSCLHKVKLSISKGEFQRSCVTRWIDFVATRKLKHLDVECFLAKIGCSEAMPLSLYKCETLVHLRLRRVWLGLFKSSVSLPCLKTMSLEQNKYANEECIESLISSCPILDDLSIVRRVNDNVQVLRVRSKTLTRLSVEFNFDLNGSGFLVLYGGQNPGLLIDAPRLKCLNFKDELSKRKFISNLDSLTKVSFDRYFDIECHLNGAGLPKNQIAHDFFSGISGVQKMIFLEITMEFISSYLKVESLPQFCNLTCLEAEFCASTAEILPKFLQSFPNLKSIILDLSHSKIMISPIGGTTVPQCLMSSLEFVEIKSRFRGSFDELEVAKYFVENSVVLEKLRLHLSKIEKKQSLVVLQGFHALLKPSNSMCQIVYVTDC